MSSKGRPKGINFQYIKSIKLNEDQKNNWNSKEIKEFLERNHKSIKLLKFLYELMETKFELTINYSSEELERLLEIEEMLEK